MSRGVDYSPRRGLRETTPHLLGISRKQVLHTMKQPAIAAELFRYQNLDTSLHRKLSKM